MKQLRTAQFWVVSCINHRVINGLNSAVFTDRTDKRCVRNILFPCSIFKNNGLTYVQGHSVPPSLALRLGHENPAPSVLSPASNYSL